MFKAISAANFMVVKKYERPLLTLIKLRDAYQKQRINIVLNNLYDVFRKSTQFWKFCDQLIELTYKLTLRNRMFAQELSKNQNLYRMIEQITRENPSFPVRIYSNYMKKCAIYAFKALMEIQICHIISYSYFTLSSLLLTLDCHVFTVCSAAVGCLGSVLGSGYRFQPAQSSCIAPGSTGSSHSCHSWCTCSAMRGSGSPTQPSSRAWRRSALWFGL